MQFKTQRVPNYLTLFRLIFSPLLFPLLLVYLLPLNAPFINALLALLFILVSLTDFFDGYLARKFKQESLVGRILDPIADKFLIYATLIALLAVHKIFFYWVVILIGREFFVMGLRHVAAAHNFEVPVLPFSKIKTAFQMILLTWMIANPYQAAGFEGAPLWNIGQAVVLFATIVLSLYSATRYYQLFMKKFKAIREQ